MTAGVPGAAGKVWRRGLLAMLMLRASTVAAAASEPATEITWYGHAAVVIKTPAGTQLAIDPWFDNPRASPQVKPPRRLDAILVSHGHFDHLGNAPQLAKRTGAPVVGSFELVGQLGLPAEQAIGGNAGGSWKVKDVTVHFVEAVHSSSIGAPPARPRYAGAALGFVVEIDGGPTLYHAGDTDVFSSMQLIAQRYRPSLGMLPIGGHFTMDPQGAALAAKLLGLRQVLPIHYGTFAALRGTPAQLSQAVEGGVQVVQMQPGDTKKF